jgi:hypothetical protein
LYHSKQPAVAVKTLVVEFQHLAISPAFFFFLSILLEFFTKRTFKRNGMEGGKAIKGVEFPLQWVDLQKPKKKRDKD